MSSMVEEQASKDWEPLQHMMHDYKGLVSSWQGILGLYNNMADKHKVLKIIYILQRVLTSFAICRRFWETELKRKEIVAFHDSTHTESEFSRRRIFSCKKLEWTWPTPVRCSLLNKSIITGRWRRSWRRCIINVGQLILVSKVKVNLITALMFSSLTVTVLADTTGDNEPPPPPPVDPLNAW